MPSPSRRPAQDDPRVRRTRGRILAVARELLPQTGAAGLTYSRLAAQAEVTRQTLYRHWPTRAALLVDLILEGPAADYPQPGTDPAAVARAWLTSLRAGMNEPGTRAAVLAVTADADRDADSAQALQRIGADRLAALNSLLEPSGRQITGEEYTRLYGPVLSRLFFERREVTDEFIEALVVEWLTTLSGPASSGA
ncbi:MAG TPA: helix-turn-helix domain-containing protein [Trebonia sp.]|nr:helix-turn-helix domain-containing protein [Trebonia sp.]